MVELAEKRPFPEELLVQSQACTLRDDQPEQITWIAPERGAERAVSDALRQHFGAAFPAPGRSTAKAGMRLVWFAPGEALLLGPPAPRLRGAYLADQGSAWAGLRLEGAGAPDVLARLVPLDLRFGRFGRGHAARSLLGQVPLVVWRAGSQALGLLVPRSMAGFAADEIKRVMRLVAARPE